MIMFIAKKNDQNRHNTTGITVTNERDRVLTVITMLPGDNKDDDLEAMRIGNHEEGQQEGKSAQRSRLVRHGSIESGTCFAGAKSGWNNGKMVSSRSQILRETPLVEKNSFAPFRTFPNSIQYTRKLSFSHRVVSIDGCEEKAGRGVSSCRSLYSWFKSMSYKNNKIIIKIRKGPWFLPDCFDHYHHRHRHRHHSCWRRGGHHRRMYRAKEKDSLIPFP